MSALLFLKTSLSRLPPCVARQVVGCCYHTEKGVYGYRPKQTERCHKLQSDCIAALNQDHGLARLVEAYRAHGHKAAKINPLLPQKPVADTVPEIDMLTGTIRGKLNTSGK
ncbi:probable 2-oxoglutarate dehydrogenase E1 component DHKTD1, mitochondrial [Micropterus salmoides]|uniref:probable 2-oxoglutarate dehydrogenase E1 component DHKTD1, mitochondrial n=1 Tax=Micropterus salmoides TaxID=27706 RepID=UPI0018EB4709|nr:probable 2-oxoglutarate dehydrogenase E1 component DHKTD1, mitochondrial [Micropterus salmoides]